jgi:hypothetical protein
LRAVAADHDPSIDSALTQSADRRQLGFLGFEFRESETPEHRASTLNNSAYIAKAKGNKIVLYKSSISVSDAPHFPSPVDTSAHSSPDCGIDSGGIAAGCKYRDTHFLGSPNHSLHSVAAVL